ncbi:preQ(1) synthase [Halorientalis regularis]|uniref:7-cyano-7-deazaguanine reductase n=1 Tax=Halorientalis regularis TaxID=660518 RepID=A0A1G7TSA8_9EURY|nr:preQ(1) synthase [Halorientalis regularis]SDG37440.1 7-cyano-7-deazaguanine reductase [Halorientalis regularis]
MNDEIDPGHLSAIPNEYPDRNTRLEVVAPEFTCLCPEEPLQPDFATIIIEYVPDELIVELKSLKLYLGSYRNVEIYHEPATNRILTDLVEACNPRWMRVTGQFNTRGGITTDVTVEHGELTDDIPEARQSRAEDLSRIPSER